MNNPLTLFEKIWSEHEIVVSPQGETLLYVDFNLINEGQSFLAFDQLRLEGRQSRRPEQHLAVTDHYLPTINRGLGTAGMPNPEIRRVVEMLDENSRDFRLPHVGWYDTDQGIAHVIAPELGFAQPGMLITCNDSHTATNGACGALAVPSRRRQSASARHRDADRLAQEAEDACAFPSTAHCPTQSRPRM